MPNLKDQIRGLHRLRSNLQAATIAAGELHHSAEATLADAIAREKKTMSREEAATYIQRVARGKLARNMCRRLRSEPTLGLRAVGAENTRPWASQ